MTFLISSNPLGKIKEILQLELGIPKDKQELKGLVKRKVDDSVLAFYSSYFAPRLA